jgi:hypothetical protein
MLAAESQHVMLLRMVRLAAGGSRAQSEAQLMVSEKMAAATHATGRLLMGDSPDSVVRRYRRKVKANARRLAK